VLFGKEGWNEFKDDFLKCEGERCEIWQVVRVPKEWKGDGVKGFFCGVCMGERMDRLVGEKKELRKKLQKVEMENEELKKKLKEKEKMMKKGAEILEEVGSEIKTMKDERRVERDERRSYAEMVKNTAKVVEDTRKVVKETIKEEVVKNNREEMRKRRVIIFGLPERSEKNEGTVKEQVKKVMEKLELGIIPKEVVRMGRKEGRTAPVIVELETEKEKWEVLKRKAILRRVSGFEKVFLEMDLSVEEREKKKKNRVMRRLEETDRKVVA